MITVLQRVRSASVTVDGRRVAEIGHGYLLLVGVGDQDSDDSAVRLAREVAKVRLMEDAEGKLGLSLPQAGGDALAVSQFTLLADFAKGNRPSFHRAAKPEVARPLFERFVTELATQLGRPVPTGVFGADMSVELVNDGPVTVVLSAF